MSIIKNSLANYVGQGTTIGFGILVTPLYLQFLGPEAFGLIGFFTLIHSWSMLMDMGLSPTLGRQVASARGQKTDFQSLHRLLRSFEVIFAFLALVIAILIFSSSNWLGTNWIKSENLDDKTIVYCICLMAVMIGFRWFSSLYRSGINGFEDQVWLNQINIIFLILRYLGSLFLLAVFSVDVRSFFEFQLLVSVLEPLVLRFRFYRKLLVDTQFQRLIFFDWSEVRSILPFALGVAYTAGLWIALTQTDRLILSGMLSLSEFGYLTLVTLVTSGITLMSQPIGAAVLPRMTLLFAQNRKAEFVQLYRKASQFVTWLAFSIAIIVGLNSESLLFAFSGNREAAYWGSKVLLWFALGNAFLAIMSYQYYLQAAIGDLKLHVIGATVGAGIQVPLTAFFAINYGVLGAAICWFCMRLAFFLFWTPIVHSKFLPRFHWSWFVKDITPILTVSVLSGILLSHFFAPTDEANRGLLFLKLVGLGLLQLLFTSAFFKIFEKRFFNPEIKLKLRN